MTVAVQSSACVAAGCDIALNCWGRMDEMVAIAAALPEISERGAERLARAMATIAPVSDYAEIADLIAKRDALLALV